MSSRKARQPTTRILIVDDHPAIREGLVTRIAREPDLHVCGEAADIPEALKLLESHHPEVAVVDISLKTGNGIDLIRRIKARQEETRILVWSMFPESLYAERALRAGAMGYVTKEYATGKIVEAIRAICDGRMYVSESIAGRLMRSAVGNSEPAPASPVEALSDRELEVFELIGEGLTTAQIAERLHVSIHTIETHRQRIKTKLNLRTAAELGRAAVQWALERR